MTAPAPNPKDTPMTTPDLLTGPDYYSVRVDEHTEETQLAAARWLLAHLDGDPEGSPEGVAALMAEAEPEMLSKHIDKQPEDVGCFCEDEGWWCQEGDGPPVAFWVFDRTIASRAVDLAVTG